jgi:hypothetical protein
MPARNKELHRTGRISWLRRAVLSANDGLIRWAILVFALAESVFPREVIN